MTSNNSLGAKRVAEFLLAAGHRRFAYVAGISTSSTNRDRESAFVKRLAASNVELTFRVEGNYSFTEATSAAQQLFRGPKRPDAVFCANDQMAMAVLEVARSEFRLRIPEDVSIIGYDDIRPAGWPSFQLTTVEQPLSAMVKATVDIMLQRISSDTAEPAHRVLEGDLVVRSTARVPAEGVIEENGRRLWRPRPRT